MLRLFGPVTAKAVNKMTEDNCVRLCKKKVTHLLGEHRAEEFNEIIKK
jgi:hypothetical protein